MKDYPGWLSENLLNYAFPWDKAQKTDLPTFLTKYNLHDSYWFGMWIAPDDQAIAIIQWDVIHPFWLYPDLFPKDIWNTNKWPFLLISFRPPPHQILFDSAMSHDYRSIIGHASSKVISAEDRETMLNQVIVQSNIGDNNKNFYLNNDLCQTVFETIYGGEIHFFHDREIEILCINWEGEILKIPSLEPE
jgi:hypothetical protein